jgi:hypothetical protein
VESGDGRTAQLTHYAYGSTLKTAGPSSHIFEFWLGDDQLNQPQLSVRGNRTSMGALIQARDANDATGLMLDFGHPLRPKLRLEDNGLLPNAVLAIENPQPNGSIAFATKPGGVREDAAIIENSGVFRTLKDTSLGNEPNDRVVFHGSSGAGQQGLDPGVLDASLEAGDVDTPQEIADRLNETRTVINALREALLSHGLIG